MMELYQNIPSLVDPIALSIGSFDIRWYSIAYIIAFFVVYQLLIFRVKKREFDGFGFVESGERAYRDRIFYFLFFVFFGIIVGARLGYVFFYDLEYFVQNPVEIFLPISLTGEFVGLYGMSYHGGFIGALIALCLYSKWLNVSFWRLSDFFVSAVPAGYFFGRIGNFLNGELYGRTTEKFWGMHFENQLILRHPSQLYEAFFEGVILFVIVWKFRNKWSYKPGFLVGIYVLGYGIARFFVEFFREPDVHLGLILGLLTKGQLLCVTMIFVGICVLAFIMQNSKKIV